jgi:hypothetical protein
VTATSENYEPELNSLLTKLSREISSDEREVETRKKRIEKNQELLRAVRGSLSALHPPQKTNGYGSKLKILKSAISRMSILRFTQDDVEREVKIICPDMEINRNRIRAMLWGLADEKEVIRQVVKGTSRNPAEFEKIDASSKTKRNGDIEREQMAKPLSDATAGNGNLSLKGIQ